MIVTPTLTRHFVWQEAIEFLPDDRVAFAGPLFQPRTVEHCDGATAVPDHAELLQVAAASVTPFRRTPSMFAMSS